MSTDKGQVKAEQGGATGSGDGGGARRALLDALEVEAELAERVVKLRAEYERLRDEAAKAEGRYVEAAFWLKQIRNARPADVPQPAAGAES